MCQSQKESPIKTQITELQKNHYISLRKKKIIENREVKKNQKNGDQKEIGNYLIPKVVLFDSYNEDEFIDMEKFEQLNLKNSLKGTSCGISRKV